MAGYVITLADGSIEQVDGADAYSQEGPLTTFFDTAGRDVVDAWASRVMSLRTTEIMMVRRSGTAPDPTQPALLVTKKVGIQPLAAAG